MAADPMTMFSATLSQCLAMMSSDEEHQTFVNWAKDRLEEVAIPQVAGLEDQAGVESSPESIYRADWPPPRTTPRTMTPSRPRPSTQCQERQRNRRPRRLGQGRVDLQPKRVPPRPPVNVLMTTRNLEPQVTSAGTFWSPRAPRAQRGHRCDFKHCHKVFTKASNLTRHKKEVHIGEKPFECPICLMSFARKDHLSQHKKIH